MMGKMGNISVYIHINKDNLPVRSSLQNRVVVIKLNPTLMGNGLNDY